MKKLFSSRTAFAVILMLFAEPVPAQDFGVFEYVVTSAEGSVDDVAAQIESSASQKGWKVLAKINNGQPEGCSYRAVVLALFSANYANQIMAANAKTGPFALVDRVNVFEDENGVHVAVVNPSSINRTVLMDDQAYKTLSADHLKALRDMVLVAVKGTPGSKQFGQIRSEGYISRTFGVVAGGKFEDKLEDLAVVSGTDWQTAAAQVRAGLKNKGAEWGMRLSYEVTLAEHKTVVFGSTGFPMDASSYSIVMAGSDDSRASFKCPGLAHAAAYPIEVVVAQESDGTKVRVVDVMFRMKMYFEDAGKWAFMKNMTMPGSIQDELKDQVEKGLAGSK